MGWSVTKDGPSYELDWEYEDDVEATSFENWSAGGGEAGIVAMATSYVCHHTRCPALEWVPPSSLGPFVVDDMEAVDLTYRVDPCGPALMSHGGPFYALSMFVFKMRLVNPSRFPGCPSIPPR